MQIITVSNGSSNYPGNFTNEEIKIINENCTGRILNLFSGKSDIGDHRIDFRFGNYKIKDVFEYLNYATHGEFQTIIIDAPYNQKFADKYRKLGFTRRQFIIFADTKRTTLLFKKIRILDPEIIIIKSWNYYIPKGYEVLKSYLCYPGGYRKSTILLILKKSKMRYNDE